MDKEHKIKIFVAHHKPWYIYEDDIYVPIQLWKKDSDIDLWILWDDTWDNISEKNGTYAELTAQYWVRKNYDLSDVDYVWFCHYRRYMSYKYKINYKDIAHCIRKSIKNGNSFYKSCSNVIDTITWYHIDKNVSTRIIKNSWIPEYVQKYKHDIFLTHTNFTISSSLKHLWLDKEEVWNEVRNIIISQYPEYERYIVDWRLRCVKNINYCNLYIMEKSLFIEYADWLFSILFALEKKFKEKNMESLCMECTMTTWIKFYGCLAERLLNLWVLYQKYNNKKSVSKKAKCIFFEN